MPIRFPRNGALLLLGALAVTATVGLTIRRTVDVGGQIGGGAGDVVCGCPCVQMDSDACIAQGGKQYSLLLPDVWNVCNNECAAGGAPSSSSSSQSFSGSSQSSSSSGQSSSASSGANSCLLTRMKVIFRQVENAGNGNLVEQVDLLDGSTVAEGVFFPLTQNGNPIGDPSGSTDLPGLVIQRNADRSFQVTLHCSQSAADLEYISAFLDIEGGAFASITNDSAEGLESQGNGTYSTWSQVLGGAGDDEAEIQNEQRIHLVAACNSGDDSFLVNYRSTVDMRVNFTSVMSNPKTVTVNGAVIGNNVPFHLITNGSSAVDGAPNLQPSLGARRATGLVEFFAGNAPQERKITATVTLTGGPEFTRAIGTPVSSNLLANPAMPMELPPKTNSDGQSDALAITNSTTVDFYEHYNTGDAFTLFYACPGSGGSSSSSARSSSSSSVCTACQQDCTPYCDWQNQPTCTDGNVVCPVSMPRCDTQGTVHCANDAEPSCLQSAGCQQCIRDNCSGSSSSSSRSSSSSSSGTCAQTLVSKTINITCQSGGAPGTPCAPADTENVTLAAPAQVRLKYTAASGHCARIRVHVRVDGGQEIVSAYTGIQTNSGRPVDPHPRSVVLNLGTLQAGAHTITVAGAEDADCGGGTQPLASWGGPLQITAYPNQCPIPPAQCGNSVVEPGEQCDDGNTTNGDGCSSTCQREATSSSSGTSSRSSSSRRTVCGDGWVTGNETCDDGNIQSGDCCSNICQVEAGCTCDNSQATPSGQGGSGRGGTGQSSSGSGGGGGGGSSAGGSSTGQSSSAVRCVDSEDYPPVVGGDDHRLWSGTVTIGGQVSADVCTPATGESSAVVEYQCGANGSATSETLDCPWNVPCVNGACVVPSCQETSDPNDKRDIKGSITFGSQTITDECDGINHVRQYSCKPNQDSVRYQGRLVLVPVVTEDWGVCPFGILCEDGACTKKWQSPFNCQVPPGGCGSTDGVEMSRSNYQGFCPSLNSDSVVKILCGNWTSTCPAFTNSTTCPNGPNSCSSQVEFPCPPGTICKNAVCTLQP